MLNNDLTVPSKRSKAALLVLAKEAGMEHLRENIFSYRGETYIPSPIGWDKNLKYNYKEMYDRLCREHEQLKMMYESERSLNHNLKTALKDIEGKTLFKVIEILNSRTANDEKVKQLRKYLNLKKEGR